MCLLKFFGRPIRPGIQNSPRRPMAGGTTNPIQLPNAPQALSDPCLDTVCPLFLADGTQVFNTILIQTFFIFFNFLNSSNHHRLLRQMTEKSF